MTRHGHLAFGWLYLSLTPGAFAQQAGQDPRMLTAFRQELQRDGFSLLDFEAREATVLRDFCDGKIPSAWGINKAASHLLIQPKPGLPRIPGELAEPSTAFQLRPNEAIVVVGMTPPLAKYFSFQPFVFTKVFPQFNVFHQPLGRQQVWASITDALNNATVHTVGPSPFNAPMALILTPDQGTDGRIRAALRSAGYPAAIINTLVVPAPMVSLGVGANADQFTLTMRMAQWAVPAAGEQYVANPPLTVLRVTPGGSQPLNPFPAPGLRVRGTGQTEMGLMSKMDQLRQGILQANPGLYATDYRTYVVAYDGYHYIQSAANAQGDTRDALYLSAGSFNAYGLHDPITLDNDEFLVVYGVNHVATGKAAYVGITVYADPDVIMTVGGVDDFQLPGTASRYLPGDPAANLLYAYKIARNCGNEPNCAPLAVVEPNCPAFDFNTSVQLDVLFRAYLEPATKIGPAFTEILYDRVTKFSPRK